MRLKGRDWREVKKWRQIQAELGYLPHYHKVGRVLMEVRFLLTDRHFWCVLNTVTGVTHRFRRNGTPLNGTRGRLCGPLVEKRKIRQ